MSIEETPYLGIYHSNGNLIKFTDTVEDGVFIQKDGDIYWENQEGHQFILHKNCKGCHKALTILPDQRCGICNNCFQKLNDLFIY